MLKEIVCGCQFSDVCTCYWNNNKLPQIALISFTLSSIPNNLWEKISQSCLLTRIFLGKNFVSALFFSPEIHGPSRWVVWFWSYHSKKMCTAASSKRRETQVHRYKTQVSQMHKYVDDTYVYYCCNEGKRSCSQSSARETKHHMWQDVETLQCVNKGRQKDKKERGRERQTGRGEKERGERESEQ